MQMQVSSSPKSNSSINSSNLIDEFEDDLMKMYSKDNEQSP